MLHSAPPGYGAGGCDTVAATYGIGKPTALKAATKHSFNKLGKINATVQEIMDESTPFLVTSYSSKPCKSMTECRQRLWSIKIGKSKSHAIKLFSLPPTTEAFLMNVLRAHLQLSHWYAALDINPPDLDPLDHGFEPDHVNKVLI